ncbi:unnamed protein product [Vitrella brassicaformis CCMP3155]|uniref:Uncharacterized protein n=1 Tax=Vitrella brassicaformis (strain CCMP3155) TaxID=1169540 RepID=A0A0G4FST0_VITBC|nr:unnamed protein product [Vitrella brassicaformis CCMP3155]|eukprot:CEM17715.1 unnamed protein product [Vitrella brassicaformis CCMP3155]
MSCSSVASTATALAKNTGSQGSPNIVISPDKTVTHDKPPSADKAEGSMPRTPFNTLPSPCAQRSAVNLPDKANNNLTSSSSASVRPLPAFFQGLPAEERFVYLLDQGTGEEWRAMGQFLRLAFIYRLTTRPLQISADSLPTATALHHLPLILAIYKTFGHRLTYQGTSLQLQQNNDGTFNVRRY